MRKLFLLCALALASRVNLSATVYTVSNDPTKPAQYTSATTALGVAAAGDTLYIYGSPNSYGDLVINKSITIIGAGFNTRKDIFYKTAFRFLDIPVGTLSNVTVDGVVGDNFRLLPGLINFSNFTIRNSIFYLGIVGASGGSAACGSTLTNWLIENCYVGEMSLAGTTACNPVSPVTNGMLVKNCVIATVGGGTHNNNITFTNCQFGVDVGGGNGFQRNVNCTYNNCIFFKYTFTQWSANVNNQFNNCLTFLTVSPSQNFDLNSWTGGGSGTANNCIINQNPLWVTTPTLPMFVITPYSSRNVWNPIIQGGSPAANAGSDGTDIGLTGGLIPYNYLAEPKIPVIRRFQLVNPVVPPNGTVSANVTATKAQ